MKKYSSKGFTFVELIVVITIMAILATIGFMVYKDYLTSSYDSNRLKQLSDIHDGLELIRVGSKLPFPDKMLELTASGTSFAYQGDAGDAVIQAIGYDGGGKDPEFGTPFVYMLSKGGKDFQLMGFVRDPILLAGKSNTYADSIDYSEFFPKTEGSSLGILVDSDTLQPIHRNLSKQSRYDIITGTGFYKAYLSDTNIIPNKELFGIIPNGSCKRILDIGNSNGNGNYLIQLPNGRQYRVYCEMEADGGGWTLVGRSVKGSSGNFAWKEKRGSILDNGEPFSFGADIVHLPISELMLSTYKSNKTLESAISYKVDDDYLKDNLLTSGNTSSDVSWVRECKEIFNGFYLTPCSNTGRPVANWGRFGNVSKFVFNWRSDYDTGLTASHYYGNGSQFSGFEGKAGMIFVR